VAGFPFRAETLPLDQWQALGELTEAIEAGRPRLF